LSHGLKDVVGGHMKTQHMELNEVTCKFLRVKRILKTLKTIKRTTIQ
jgi:hypothetical protein